MAIMPTLEGRHRQVLRVAVVVSGVLCVLAVASRSFMSVSVFAQLPLPTVTLKVNASDPGREMPANLFGLFYEEINHAGSGGLWAELVQNRGFEAGGPNTPSIFDPWFKVGSEAQVTIGTDRSSPLDRNPIALKVEVLCDDDDDNEAPNLCPKGGVGAANPGFWGMNVLAGSKYLVEFWLRSTHSFKLCIAFTSRDGTVLAQEHLSVDAGDENGGWSKQSVVVEANSTDHYARLSLTSGTRGSFWLDQVSAMPLDTFKGHGFRKELATMLSDLKPGFLRFPGGCYVEGVRLTNAFRWRDSVGPYENRPGHYGDIWNYWSDDGFGFYEGLQLAEDLGAAPIWVFNNGISHWESVPTEVIGPWVQDTLDGIEFARGPANSTWGAVRAKMGHPEPFDLRYVAIGNEDCWKPYYRGNYMEFYKAIKLMYPDIQMISNCDGSSSPLDHPADFYDFHIYTDPNNLFAMRHQFDFTSRVGPKAFVSEYAVTKNSGHGNLVAALAEGAFLIGIELNSDAVHMASYAPLFVNDNDRRWNPDAIVFNSWQEYGTPSYWVQMFFKNSNGAHLVPSTIQADSSTSLASLITSVVRKHNSSNGLDYLIVKAVNFGNSALNLDLKVSGLSGNTVVAAEQSYITLMTSESLMDENSFTNPVKVTPQVFKVSNARPKMQVILPAYSIIALELGLDSANSTTSDSTADVIVQVLTADS